MGGRLRLDVQREIGDGHAETDEGGEGPLAAAAAAAVDLRPLHNVVAAMGGSILMTLFGKESVELSTVPVRW